MNLIVDIGNTLVKLAVFDGGRIVAQRCVERLQQHQGQRWALCFDDSYLFLVALLATLHAHKTPVIPGHSRLSQLEEQRALFDGVLSEKPLGWSGPTWVISRSRRSPTQTVTFHPLADDAAIELFTSGSTGQPKRIIKSQIGRAHV